MTALSAERATKKYGTDDQAEPLLLSIGVKGSTKIYGGSMVAVDSSGRAVPASADTTLKVLGRCERQADNSSGADNAIPVTVRRGVFYYATPSSGVNQISVAKGQLCYASDDQTVNATDGNGQYPAAGVVVAVDAASGQVAVFLGQPSLYEQALASEPTAPFKARAVITSIASYVAASGVLTASAVGALGAQDGITLSAGDVVLLGADLAATAADEGPYVVSVVGDGSTKFVLSRPDWFAHGSTIKDGSVIELGSEGTNYKGSSWKCFPAGASKVVGTDAPHFWPRACRKIVTLSSGTYTWNAAPLWLRSATESVVAHAQDTPGGTMTATVGFSAPSGSRAAGVPGTGTVVINAVKADKSTDTACTSTVDVAVHNW